jgi:hypothetical protein
MKEQRRSHRILASIPVELQSEGEPELALTAVINLNGALILSAANWPTGSHLRIQNPETELHTLARVVWCGNQDATGSYKLGVEFQVSAPEFWGERYDPEGPEVSSHKFSS